MTEKQLLKSITTLNESIRFCQHQRRYQDSADLQILINNLVELRDSLRLMYEASTMITENDFHSQMTLKGRVITPDEVLHNMARAANVRQR